MSNPQFPLSNRALRLDYDFNHCPGCGSLLPSSIHITSFLQEPEIGFFGDIDSEMIRPPGVTCLRLLCDSCFDKASTPPPVTVSCAGDHQTVPVPSPWSRGSGG